MANAEAKDPLSAGPAISSNSPFGAPQAYEQEMDFGLEDHKVPVELHFTAVRDQLQQLRTGEYLPSTWYHCSCEELLKMAKEWKEHNLYTVQKLLSRALETSETPSQLCECYSEYAEVHLCCGPLSEALVYANKVLSLSAEHDLNGMMYKAYMLCGHAYRSTGKFDISCAHYGEAERVAKRCLLGPDCETCAFIYQQMCSYNLGKNSEALTHLLPLLQSQNLSPAVGGELKQLLGNIYRSAANWHDSVKYFEESISSARTLVDNIKVAERLGELGNVYRSSGWHKKALELQQMFYQFSLGRGDVASLAAASGYIGFTYYTMGEQEYALKYLMVRYRLAGEIGDIQGVRWCLNNIGKVYLALGKFDGALKLFSRSAKIASELGDLLGEGTAYGNMGTASRDAGMHQDAIKYHSLYRENAILRMDVGGVAIMENELALDHLRIGNFEDARKFAWMALQTSLKIRSCLGSQDDTLKIANHEKNQAVSYGVLQYVLVEQQLTEAALLVSELGRARALSDILHANNKDVPTLFSAADMMDESGELQHSMISDKMKYLQQLLKALRSNLVVYSLVDHPLLTKAKQKWLYIWLVQNTGELHFEKQFLGDVNGADFTLGHHFFSNLQHGLGVRDIKFNSEESVDKSAQPCELSSTGVRDIINSESCEEVEVALDALGQLYAKLVAPIHGALMADEQTSRVTFIPHSVLFNVPFAALRCPDGKYLVENVAVSIAPSIDFLSLSLHRAQGITRGISGSKCLVVGNPLMPNEAIFQLPGATEEAVTVATLLGCEPYCGTSATKNLVVSSLPGAQIIHLATHAILNDSLQDHINRPHPHDEADYTVKGAVILSCSDEHCSGVLTSNEIQGMGLGAEIAVLSCCKTGCGKITNDGILGLSRALLASGVCCIIVTQWSIYDTTTTAIMKDFYEGYRQSRDAPSALRCAMLAAKGLSPVVWAPFCVIGVSPGAFYPQC